MIRSAVWMASLLFLFAGLPAQAQSRWEKFQEKMDEFRPKGKILKQIADNREESSADKDESSESDRPAKADRRSESASAKSPRRVPAQNASRQSILSTARNLPSDGVILGIQIEPSFLPAKKLVVSEVDQDSPAAEAGLRTGDQITAVGGIPTPTLKSFDNVLSSLSGGDQVVIEFIRNRNPERTLVHFPPSAESSVEQPETAAAPYAAELPPTPEMFRESAAESNPAPAATHDLRSVLSDSATARKPAAGQFAPPYNPTPRSAGFQSSANAGNGDLEQASAAELRDLVRQQQQQIDSLIKQLDQLRNASPQFEQGSIEQEELILDPNGN